MKIIGQKEILEALENIKLTKEEYQGWEIDSLILQYHGLPKDTLLEEVTEPSGNFADITEVYTLIDLILSQKGYITDDLALYKKVR